MSNPKVEADTYRRSSHSDDGDSQECLLPHEDQRRLNPPANRPRTWLVAIAGTAACITTFALGVLIGTRLLDRDSMCTRHVTFSPALLEEVPIHYEMVRFNGSLFKENVFRKPASPEVDAAWKSLGVDYHSLALPEKYAAQAGIQPDQVKINKKYGGGYPANVEGLHQLHCLNLVRQSLYYNYDYYKSRGEGAFSNDDYVVQAHVSHCLDIVRQQLMCTVDIGLLGQVWIRPDDLQPFVDFNTQHKCRNFEAVRQWAEKHQLPEEVPEDFLEPPKPGDTIYAETP